MTMAGWESTLITNWSSAHAVWTVKKSLYSTHKCHRRALSNLHGLSPLRPAPCKSNRMDVSHAVETCSAAPLLFTKCAGRFTTNVWLSWRGGHGNFRHIIDRGLFLCFTVQLLRCTGRAAQIGQSICPTPLAISMYVHPHPQCCGSV